jgi:hypothetical protein
VGLLVSVRMNARSSNTGILAHHASALMFKDMTMIHKGMLPRGQVIKGDKQFGLVLDEHYILPTAEMSGHRPTIYRQNAKIGPISVEGMSKTS